MGIHWRNSAANASALIRRRTSKASFSLRELHHLSAKLQRQLPCISLFSTNLFATFGTTSAGARSLNFDNINKPMDLSRLYRFLQLESFTEDELRTIFARIQQQQPGRPKEMTDPNAISHAQVTNFFVQRFRQIEQQKVENSHDMATIDATTTGVPKSDNLHDDDDATVQMMRQQYAAYQATRMFHVFSTSKDGDLNSSSTATISLDLFVSTIRAKATDIDIPGMWPITVSMLLVGSSVGILTPAMPFVVEELGLTPGQYGYVVSAFALAKMMGNIPSAILVERHGRKVSLEELRVFVAIGNSSNC
jgi:hypothetical protein